MGGLLNIGLSGLNASRLGLETASHNMASESTPGFHKQYTVQVSNPPFFTGNGFIGRGTHVAMVWRSYDDMLEKQVMAADTRVSEYAAYYEQINQINNLLGDTTTGLSPALAKFFAGVQEVAANPTSSAARQAMISNAQSLVSNFKYTQSRLTEIRQGVENDISSTVDQINMYAQAIANTNQQIAVAQVAGAGFPANDLLDQRDQLITELNKLVNVQTVQETDGSLSVFFGSGQSLVTGGAVTALGAVRNPDEPMRSAIAIMTPQGVGQILPENLIGSGKLGGLLEFRRESLDKAQNQLGLLAVGLMTEFNNQHVLGQDLDGELGLNFFNVSSPTTIPTGMINVSFDPANVAQLTGSDYKLEFDGTNYTLFRLSDGATLINAGALPTPPASIDGLQFSGSTMTAGSSVLIQPTRFAAGGVSVALNDPRKIAAGSPVSVATAAANQGNGKVDGIVVKNTAGMVVTPPTVSFPSFALTYNGAPGAAGTFTLPVGYTLASGTPPVADNTYNPATDSAGKTFILTGPGGMSFSFTVSGTPANLDVFNFSPTDKGVADNRNANLLGALQTKNLFFDSANGPTTSANGLFARVVTDVGNKTREIQLAQKSQEALYNQASKARDSVSGVNMDEELSNLLRYQQAFQASAKVMSTAQTIFDAMLSIAR